MFREQDFVLYEASIEVLTVLTANELMCIAVSPEVTKIGPLEKKSRKKKSLCREVLLIYLEKYV